MEVFVGSGFVEGGESAEERREEEEEEEERGGASWGEVSPRVGGEKLERGLREELPTGGGGKEEWSVVGCLWVGGVGASGSGVIEDLLGELRGRESGEGRGERYTQRISEGLGGEEGRALGGVLLLLLLLLLER